MKINIKMFRNNVLETLQLPENANQFKLEKLYFIIFWRIQYLKKYKFDLEHAVNSITLYDKDYQINDNQKNILEETIVKLDKEETADAYKDIISFIQKGTSKAISEEEMNYIIKVVTIIKLQIRNKIDLYKLHLKVINEMDDNSIFSFCLREGIGGYLKRFNGVEVLLNYYKKTGVEITNEQKTLIKNEIEIEKIKKLLIKYRNQIYSFSMEQEDINYSLEHKKLYGRKNPIDYCYGSIDGLKFHISNEYEDKKLNEFYEIFKKELFNIIDI